MYTYTDVEGIWGGIVAKHVTCLCGETGTQSFRNDDTWNCHHLGFMTEWDESRSMVHVFEHDDEHVKLIYNRDGVTHIVTRAYANKHVCMMIRRSW